MYLVCCRSDRTTEYITVHHMTQVDRTVHNLTFWYFCQLPPHHPPFFSLSIAIAKENDTCRAPRLSRISWRKHSLFTLIEQFLRRIFIGRSYILISYILYIP